MILRIGPRKDFCLSGQRTLAYLGIYCKNHYIIFMGLGSFIISLVLLGLGLATLIGLTWAMMNPLLGTVRGKKGSSKIRKYSERLKRIDDLIESKKADEALKQLRKAVLLDATLNEAAIRKLKEHHQNVLSRCLVLEEEIGSRAENIAEVEHFLMQRIELQNLLIKATESFTNLKFRREKAGKDLPNWSKTDYEKRIKEIQGELKKNESEANEAIDRLFTALATPTEDNIVYH